MRIIKFRAWNKKNKKMLYAMPYPQYNIEMDILTGWKSEDENYVYMQFTGLKDLNGCEIYEGDILKHIPDGLEPHNLLEVFWDDVMQSFQSGSLEVKKGNLVLYKAHLYQSPIMEEDYWVEGNKYQNPELHNE